MSMLQRMAACSLLVAVATAQAPRPSIAVVASNQPTQRAVMQRISLASRQPRRPDPADHAWPKLVGFRVDGQSPTEPASLLIYDGDLQAVNLYREAALLDDRGAQLVLAHATACERGDDALRAMHGVLLAFTERVATDAGTRTLLLSLIDHADDDIAAIACALLAQTIRAGDTTALPMLRERALAAFPADRSELIPAAGLAPAPGMAECSWGGDRTSRLVLLAMHTGDRDLLLRIAAQLPAGAKPPQVHRHAHFTLLAAAIAAPRVDGETARQIHSWYMHHVDAWDPNTKALTPWHCGVLATLTRIHPHLPDHLQQTYGRLRDWQLLHDHVDGRLGGLQHKP